MKKIGILTINDYANYGNRLQNYAVQQVVQSLNMEAVTIINTSKTNKNNNEPKKNILTRFVKNCNGDFFKKLKNKAYFKLNKKPINEARTRKIERFESFTSAYIKETDFNIAVNNIPDNMKNEFDYFVTGSDQVWNPSFRHFSEIDFLTFAPKEKRVAFSPSFGITKIPKELEDDFKEWIDGIKNLSVREDAGAEIISELTGRDATVLVDPTMMLDEVEWLKIASESIHKPKKKFVCTYFLGQTYNAYKKDIKRIARENNLELVNLGSIYDLQKYSIDPSEFLDFINSSELFLTDSFHGAIFSIIFKKPFIVFDRLGNLPSMNSRIDTLLSKFKLEDRKWEKVKQSNDIFDVNFSNVPKIMENEQRRTLKYLKYALDLEDTD